MPLYDYKCMECDNQFEEYAKIDKRNGVMCPKCNHPCEIQITNSHSQDWFKPHWNPNFDIDPVFVRSRNHMKQLCKKYNMTSRALGDVRNITEV